MSTNEYSDKKRQLASKLVQDRRRLLDSLTSNRPIPVTFMTPTAFKRFSSLASVP